MLEDIEEWLQPDVKSRSREIDGLFNMATDVGMTREENQDRVALLRVTAKSTAFTCVCVCDGMGGMVDGGKAATIALASFFTSLIANRRLPPLERLERSVQEANSAVFARVNGGGATLSALLVENGQLATANVGDSRIYRFSQGGLKRLTVDDTMAEAYGAVGTGLLQFIGMKSGLKPHVKSLEPSQDNLVITSDGAHRIGEDLLSEIIRNSPNRQTLAERVLTVANWIGGVDNATIVVTEALSRLARQNNGSSPEVSVWSPSGKLKIAWTPSSVPAPSGSAPSQGGNGADEPSAPEQAVLPETKTSKKPEIGPLDKPKNSKRKRAEKRAQIEIGFSEDEPK